ncbi:MAG: Inward rectifier potassium channel Irk, partial [Bacteroidetes bacterium]|nr:Inward rectifier potassium channel Irk [Bacteroidota bacterium]
IRGVHMLRRFSIFRFMLEMPFWRFLVVILFCYLAVNLFFAAIYSIIGVEHLGGMDAKTLDGKFWEAFFFSAQTLSTVGYGHVYPAGMPANIVAAAESLLGLLMFAIATGLMYGRFSQPKAYIQFSNRALLTPFKNGVALMLRFAPYKKHQLSEVEVKVTLALPVMDNGALRTRFYNMELEISKANALALNWTIVHAINENSPFYRLSREEIQNSGAEILVYIKAYDEGYANTVISRSSYTMEELVFGARFVMMYEPDMRGKHTILDHSKLHLYEPAELPAENIADMTAEATA